MGAPSRHGAVFTANAQLAFDETEKLGGNLTVVNETDGIAFLAVFNAFHDFAKVTLGDVVVDIELRVARQLDQVRVDGFELEQRENLFQVVADDVLEQDDVLMSVDLRQDQKTR